MKTLVAAGLSALALAACASDPAPHPAASGYAEGYRERALSANRYLIDYRMDGGDYQRAFDLALWRAAEVTLERGYASFEILHRDSATDPGARSTTSFAAHHGMAYHRQCGMLSCTTTARPVAWRDVQLDANGRRPSRVVSLEILLGDNPSTNSPNAYRAADVIRNLQRR